MKANSPCAIIPIRENPLVTAKKARLVDITILESAKSQFPKAWVRRVVLSALDRALPGESCQLGLVIADDGTIQRLNRDYRGSDEVTDVLAFSDLHPGHWEGEEEPTPSAIDETSFFIVDSGPKYLGEVVISYPQAQRQATTEEGGLEREMALLIAHGVLHVLGFDHMEAEDTAAMRAMENKVLSSVLL